MSSQSKSSQHALALMFPIMLYAAALRFHKFNSIPPGKTHDQGSIGIFVKQNELFTGEYALRIGIYLLPSLNNRHTESGADFVLLDPVELANP